METQFNQIDARWQVARQPAVREESADAAVRGATAALLKGEPLPPPPLTEADIAALKFERTSVRGAIQEQREILNDTREEIAGEIAASVELRHRAAMREVLKRLRELAEAVGTVTAIEAELGAVNVRRGAHWPSLRVEPDIFALGSSRDPKSALSKLIREIEPYAKGR